MWGSSYAVTKTAYSFVPPMHVVWWRMIVALIAFVPVILVARRVNRASPMIQYQAGDWRWLGLLVLCIPCLYFTFEGFAISFTTSSQAGVVTAVMPLIVAVTAWVVLHERPMRLTLIAAVVSVIGVAVLSLAGHSQADASNPALGNLLELGAMLTATGSTLAIKRLSARYSPLLLTGLQMAAGTVFFAPMALLSGRVDVRDVPVGDWLAIAYLGVGCGLGAFALYNSALQLMPASRAALAMNAIPVVALMIGWLGMGESMTPVQAVACVVIIGVVLAAQVVIKS